MPCIYRIISPSGKSYIGQTEQTFEERVRGHRKKSSNCILLKRAADKYGWDNMKAEVLLYCNKEDLNEYERAMIIAYDTMAPNGYNCSSGGEVDKVVCEGTKQRISNTLREGYQSGRIQKGWNYAKYTAIQSDTYKRKRIENSFGTIYNKGNQWRIFIPSLWCANGKPHSMAVNCKHDGEIALKKLKEYALNGIKMEKPLQQHKRKRSDCGIKRPHTLEQILVIRKKAKGTVSFNKKAQKYKAVIPQSWTSNNKQRVIGMFIEREYAQNALTTYYQNHVESFTILTDPEGFEAKK